ncbi:MAG TPA: hypothetical protein ENH28_04275 [Euryarchaeota archaeon]|nr:hypothetical protein BMS3Bbin15_01196 [archaeon BMS3Bbin15]HDL15354.1 hypothetical protein [Euryarchaeota archaeon]
MRIVSDTSSLIILEKSEAVFILDDLFDDVLIPESVHKELFKKGKEFFSSLKILDATESGDDNLAKDTIWMKGLSNNF